MSQTATGTPIARPRRPWRTALLLLLAFLLGGAAVVAVDWAQNPSPQPGAFVLFHLNNRWGLVEPVTAGSDEMWAYARTHAGLVRSRIVLNAALRSPRVAKLHHYRNDPDALAALEKAVEVTFPEGPQIMRVVLRGPSEHQAVEMLDAIAEAYVREIVNKERLELESRQRHITEIASRYGSRVKQLRASMRKMREALGTGDKKSTQLRQQLAVKELAVATEELLKLRSSLRQMRTQLALLESGKADFKDEKGRNAEQVAAALRPRIALAEKMEKVLETDRQRLHDISTDVTGKVLDIEDWTPELDEALSMFTKLSRRAEVMLVESQAPARITLLQQSAPLEVIGPSLWERLTGAGRQPR